MNTTILPSVNAALNSASVILLVLGYTMIRQKAIRAHKFCMLLACVTSSLFLTSYIYYHLHHGRTHFHGQGWVRPLYFSILISHTILAVLQLPIILLTFYRAFKGQFDKHKSIARITLPIWLYVSVTGVVVYYMLYKCFPIGTRGV